MVQTKTLSYEEACRRDFNVGSVLVIEQIWDTSRGFSYETLPRPDHGILLCLQGMLEYLHNGVSLLSCKPGDILYLPKGSHYYAGIRPNTKSILVNFDLKDSQSRDFRFQKHMFKLAEGELGLYAPRFRALLKKSGTSALFMPQLKAELLLLICDLFHQYIQRQEIPEKYKEIAACLPFIENNLGQKLSVPFLAKHCMISETKFRMLFREYTGDSPVHYINRLKIERACQMLLSSEVTMEYICEQLNFYDLSYFHKLFRSFTGLAPSQYRLRAGSRMPSD